MSYFEIINKDAGDIYAIHQILLNNPQVSTLVTGMKRDTLLLKNVISVKNTVHTVLDISSHANSNSLITIAKSRQHNSLF